MIHDIGQKSLWQAHAPLYPGCTNFTWLSSVLELVNLKARYGWSNKNFIELLVLLKKMFPKDSMMSKITMRQRKYYVMWVWSTRKCMHALMITYCTKMSLQKCISALHMKYHSTKWRMMNVVMMKAQKKIAQQRCMCWYLPIIWRFKKLFANGDNTKNLAWRADGRKGDGLTALASN